LADPGTVDYVAFRLPLETILARLEIHIEEVQHDGSSGENLLCDIPADLKICSKRL
jgi:hypothetical protein